jgi:hypothetical protein
MKVNLKKIGAIVAGATILASSVSFAGLMFGSTQLVDDNGAPTAKVVVGEKAAASDGVAGALIASKIVSEAYKMSNFTAQISGSPTCDAGGAAAGDCTVSDEKVTLEVTVPGAVAAGTATINNLIGDYLDRDLIDRGESETDYTLSGSDTSDPANPWKDGNGGHLGNSYITMHRVSGSEFSPLKTTTLTDNSAAKTYSEQQDIWFHGDNHYDTTEDDVVGRLEWVTYTIKFKGSGDDLGIPVCTKGVDNDYTACKDVGGNVDDATETHKLQVKFLGEDWIISEMNAPSAPPNLTDENELVNGGSIKLAKESISGIVNQGESLSVDNLKFQLDDLEAHGDTTAAIISVLDANDNVLKKDKVTPATTKEFLIQGKSYRLHVFKVAPGYTFGAKWADMSIFSHELELVDGQELDPDEDNNEEYEVYLGWKNRAASTADVQPDHLRTIILHGEDIDELSSGDDSDMLVGDYVPIVQDPVKWKLSYNGLDLKDADKDSLTFDIETSNKSILSKDGPHDGSSGYVDCNITAPFVEVKSGKSGSTFEIESVDYGSSSSGGGSATMDEFIVAVSGGSCDGAISSVDEGTVFMEESTSGSARWTVTEYSSWGSYGPDVGFSAIGDGVTDWFEGGVISWADVGASDELNTSGTYIGNTSVFNGNYTGDLDWVFGVSEKAGVGTSNDFNDIWLFGLSLDVDPSDADFDIAVSSGGTSVLSEDEVRYVYAGIVDPEGSSTSAEEGFISERGSEFEAIDKQSVRFDMANKLARAQWFLASVTANATPGTTQLTLKEGETGTVSSVTIKAKSIDQVAVCAGGAGGSPACTPNMSGVSAMVLTDGLNPAATVTGATPYAFSKYTPLVMLDKDAVGVSTVVSVGGDAVNTVTKSILSGMTVDWSANPVMVKEVVKGSKIVVAGETAADTTKAADEFIKNLTK